MYGFGRKGHGKRHDIGNPKDHKGDIYDALVGAINALTAANVAVDKKTLDDAISAAIVGMDWQSTVIRFEAMVTNEPVAPSDGDRYISTEAGNIPSTTQAVLVDDVCEWDSATSLWIVTTPDDGWAVQETQPDPNIAWWYSGSAWRKIGTMVDHSNLLSLNWSVCGHVLDKYFAGDCVDEVTGNDTNGDGSFLYPYKTYQRPINLASGNEIYIIATPNVANQSVSVPVGKRVYIMLLQGTDSLGSTGNITTLTLTEGCIFSGNNIDIQVFDDTAVVTNAHVYMENGEIITSISSGSTKTIYEFHGTTMSAATWAYLKANSASLSGNANIRDRFVSSKGFDANSEDIINVKDPSAAQHADTQNARDAAITTHSGLPNAHHPQAHKDDHDPEDGVDPLDTAAPSSINENANAKGSAHSFARSDHNHQHLAGLHENGGGAEISVTDLSGLLADDQHIIDAEAVAAFLTYLDYQYVESEAEQTETGSSWVLKSGGSLSWTPPIAGDYIIEWSMESTNSSSVVSTEALIELDNGGVAGNGTEIGFHSHEPENVDDYHENSGFKKLTLTQAAHRIDVAMRRTGAGIATAKLRRVRITARRVA